MLGTVHNIYKSIVTEIHLKVYSVNHAFNIHSTGAKETLIGLSLAIIIILVGVPAIHAYWDPHGTITFEKGKSLIVSQR